jgi:hypothetical protein
MFGKVVRSLTVAVLCLGMIACGTKLSLPDGASFDARSGLFEWKGGEVKLPPDLKYTKAESDTFEGEFKSDSGKILILHDIGARAGAFAQQEGAVAFEERVVDGARVWIGQRSRSHGQMMEMLHVVTFPDNGCANFFIESNDVRSASVIRAIADSFKPRNTAKPEPGVCVQRKKEPPTE